jgi:hypothetical protein
MNRENEIILINGPLAEGELLHSPSNSVIYSVTLANGMVVTSPEGFPSQYGNKTFQKQATKQCSPVV